MRPRNFWPLVALAALLVFNLLFTTGFARVEFRDGRLFGTLVDIFQNGAPVMLLAVGMTLVIALGGIDLSVGSVMALSGAVAALLMTEHGQSVPMGILAALGVALLVGVINGALVSYGSIQPIIVTLVTLVMGRGLAQTLTQDQKVRFEIPAFEFIGNGTVLGLPFPVLLVAAVALGVSLLLRRTATGLYIEAMGGNPQAARLCGLRVHVIRLMAYMACALCAGMAGLIAAADIKEADVANAGLYLELDAILAVVLGGTSLSGGRANLVGSLIGAIFIQTLTIMLQMRGVITEHTLIIKAIVALSVCFMQTPSFERIVRRFRPAEGA
ncbi:ABC transporter permease [Stigmatella aurantiaca]|uniref:Inner-membrane translocator n=1 Tax=Stigmatella aurantiaca (strain DW4/3-1) TaxID=378806 RepID=Q08R27_STIAD|nr:ABC transporter permease [Stigmatella aurantiaca]ADO72198.1 Inner-membrane translocator [Stigmatella aurantiaca DW4/3-1]EAU62932.1 ribose transport system permease protein RbsC [Stigmatella aurantiaca DW4/3-1]